MSALIEGARLIGGPLNRGFTVEGFREQAQQVLIFFLN